MFNVSTMTMTMTMTFRLCVFVSLCSVKSNRRFVWRSRTGIANAILIHATKIIYYSDAKTTYLK